MGAPMPNHSPDALRQELSAAIAHLEHLLPGQAPIKDFVHHNTLHGYQHLPFPEALSRAERITGHHGYEPVARFRDHFARGRIRRADLEAVLDAEPSLAVGEIAFHAHERAITRRDLYLAALLYPLKPVTVCQLNWQIEAQDALHAFQPDAGPESRARLLRAAAADGHPGEAAAVQDLWQGCLEVLGLQHFLLHPEELLDLTPERAEQLLARGAEPEDQGDEPVSHQRAGQESLREIDALFHRIGHDLTLSGLLRALCGHDPREEFRPLLIRHLASHLDQGLAAWHDRRELGLYAAWRGNAIRDPGWLLDQMAGMREDIAVLPDDPLEAIITELHRLGLERARWTHYLERLALELPGWSGMFLWRHLHPGYEGSGAVRVEMTDYLAVRLIYERVFCRQWCARLWQVEPNLDVLRGHLRHHRAEFLVRHALFNTRLPEYLSHRAQHLADLPPRRGGPDPGWQQLADMIWTWRQSPAADQPAGYSVHRHGWRLFRLAQHLGLNGAQVRLLGAEQLETLFACIDGLDANQAGFVWLRAYERHYRDKILNALAANHGRGNWPRRDQRPESQIVFCMDEREEGLRRHLEQINPQIETLGAAAHFNVFNYFYGLDDDRPTVLCPVVAVPSHAVREQPRPGEETQHGHHRGRLGLRRRLGQWWVQETRRNLVSATLLLMLAAPASALLLAGKQLAPRASGQWLERLRRRFDRDPNATRIQFTAPEVDPQGGGKCRNGSGTRPARPDASAQRPQEGFTTEEQADRLEDFLRNIGLVDGFAPLPVIMGHGSHSQNNPHLAAYSCGACSGRNSGPNARLLAAIANRPEVRDHLRQRGIAIPADCWFLGAEHNTCNEGIHWYDSDLIPEALAAPFERLRAELAEASRGSAHERVRKFASAPRQPSRQQAADHVAGRALDFSQARPELGHATNACALVGRRAAAQGAFFDRRMFMISYDPGSDPDGIILERLLLANGPVGAGINLEYYFSTVNNEGYGCGTKITHNVAGLLGVMEGTSSDLRTGLPKQMIEIHEAMRLLVIIEANTDLITAIYQRQPPLQELIGNGWLLVAAKDPDSPAIQLFEPERGWVAWQGAANPPPRVACSADWYHGQMDPLDPVLLEPRREASPHVA